MLARLARLRLSRFALIGAAATAIYAATAAVLSAGFDPLLPATTASVCAYALAALVSYAGHKYVTFGSAGAHVFEAPRFVAVTAMGIAFAGILPKLMVDGAGLEPLVPIAVTCIVVPVVNYVVLERWVFGQARAERRS